MCGMAGRGSAQLQAPGRLAGETIHLLRGVQASAHAAAASAAAAAVPGCLPGALCAAH